MREDNLFRNTISSPQLSSETYRDLQTYVSLTERNDHVKAGDDSVD